MNELLSPAIAFEEQPWKKNALLYLQIAISCAVMSKEFFGVAIQGGSLLILCIKSEASNQMGTSLACC